MSAWRKLAESLDPRGCTGRRAYALAGVLLLAIKLLLDRAVVGFSGGGEYWSLLSYWAPGTVGRPGKDIPSFAIALLLIALPFIAVGVVLTMRRLRDVGWPRWLALLFFVPGINFLLFVVLCLFPAPGSPRESPSPETGILGWLARTFALRNPALSAVMAIVLTGLLIVPMTWMAAEFLTSYGWGVFVAQPFILGLLAALIHSAPERRSWAGCVGVAMLALVFCAFAILVVAIEGAICLLMAGVLAVPLALLGATVGYYLQLARWNVSGQAARMYAASWIALPFTSAAERWTQPQPQVMSVTTAVEIAAPRETVWRHVVTFAELPPPAEAVFRSGIAYPVRATINGRGVGAVRRCEFSTGPFVEPITVWDEPNRLAFDVVAQPHPMREWSPYRALESFRVR